MGRKAGPEMSEAIWRKTMKEAREGTMRGPFTHSDIVARHGRFCNVVPSFGLERGVDDKGERKFRRIDDHSACLSNVAAHRTQKIDMAMIDYLLVMVKGLVASFDEGARVGTEDMKGAYRQVPLPDSQV